MSGETADKESGWTVDTLHHSMQRQLNQLDENFQRQLATVETVHGDRLEALRVMLNERYATQTKAVDAAFVAQQTAMSTALLAAETAVDMALQSAEKAVSKAEVATDKRFELMNGLRGQMADQATRFMSKGEYEANQKRMDERLTDVQHRLDLSEGAREGGKSTRSTIVAVVGAAASFVVMVNILLAYLGK